MLGVSLMCAPVLVAAGNPVFRFETASHSHVEARVVE